VDVVARQVVLAAAGVPRPLADVQRVERCAEVDEERVVDLAGEDLASARQGLHRLRRHGIVVGDRLGPDVVGRHRDVAQQRAGRAQPAVLVAQAGHRVRLLDVQVRVVDRPDRRRGVEVGVLVAHPRAEHEAVADVVAAVARVVDVQVVGRAVVEPVEVRASGGILEGNPVGDQRERPWCVGCREGVDVGVVRGGVERRQRRFAVARADAQRDRQGTGHDGRGERGGEDVERAHGPIFAAALGSDHIKSGANAVLLRCGRRCDPIAEVSARRTCRPPGPARRRR
jgi:hypothetical protein